jgi:predicted ribonuclease YlaK
MQSLWAPIDTVQGVFCEARAGTGKTTLAALAGAYEVERGTYDRIIYVRNALPIRDLGHLPGSLSEKEAPYMAPFIDALDKVQPGLYERWSKPLLKEPPKALAITSAYVRGLTWDRSFVIIDEAQSFELDELQAVYTRCTETCKVVTVGSLRQNDNRKQRKIAGLTPFEVYMRHFQGTLVAFHKLETDYRGWFSRHADDVSETVEKLQKGAQV